MRRCPVAGRASPCRPAATVNALHQQAGHTKALDPTLEIEQVKIPYRRGPSTHEVQEARKHRVELVEPRANAPTASEQPLDFGRPEHEVSAEH